MKKLVLLLSAAGAVGGVVYALSKANRSSEGETNSGKKMEMDVQDQQNATTGSAHQATMSAKAGAYAGHDATSDERIGEASMGKNPIGSGNPSGDTGIDDRGTNQSEALELLTNVRDSAFDADDGKLALALGRPVDEVGRWLTGAEPIDADVLLKARALATGRGVDI